MGPLHALIRLAERRGFHPFHEQIVASKRTPLAALHVEEDGRARVEALPEGFVALGMRAWSRTGTQPMPRAFRDDEKNTLDHGKFRDAYAGVVKRMVDAHPRSKPLRALLTYLQGEFVVPFEQRIEGALYIPMHGGAMVVHAILEDLVGARTDPYGPPTKERLQPDVITGEMCRPSSRKPIRILGLGTATGTTLLSVDDPTTASRWAKDQALRVPMSEYSMNMHVIGLQSLVDDRDGTHPRWVLAAKRGEDRLAYMIWCAREDGPEQMIIDVLKGKARLEDVRAWAQRMQGSDDQLCVLGLSGTRRTSIQAWSCLPLREAAFHVLAYAEACSTPRGLVFGISRLATLAVPAHLCTDGKTARELANSSTDWQTIASVVDHVVEGHPFPWLLRERVRFALLSQDDIHENSHTRNQLHLLQAHAS
jgi:hypothetical protein